MLQNTAFVLGQIQALVKVQSLHIEPSCKKRFTLVHFQDKQNVRCSVSFAASFFHWQQTLPHKKHSTLNVPSHSAMDIKTKGYVSFVVLPHP